MKCTLLLIIVYSAGIKLRISTEPPTLNEVFAWKYVDFDLSSRLRRAALASGSWVPANNLPMSFTIWRDKLFLPIFRWKLGVVSALNYINISSNSQVKSPLLIPYPSAEVNYVNENPSYLTISLPSEKSIISSARAWADTCDRLWVLDAGLVNFFGETRHLAPPAIVIFDLRTDTLIRRFSIPDHLINTKSIFASIQIDVEKRQCQDAYAYVTDLQGLIVYSFKQNVAWRVDHNFFGDDPLQGNFFIKGINVQATDGLYGIAISNRRSNGARRIYFHSLSSTKEFYVSNTVLKNQSYIAAGKFYYDFHLIGDRGKLSQSTRSYFDLATEVIFYPLVHRFAIACWNTKYPMKRSTLDKVYENKRHLNFPSDVFVDKKRDLWAISNSLVLFLYGNFNNQSYNVRIYKGSVKNALKGTKCW